MRFLVFMFFSLKDAAWTWTEALREQYLKEDIRMLIKDSPKSCKSSRHKTRKAQVKKLEEKKIGLNQDAPDWSCGAIDLALDSILKEGANCT